MNAGMIKKNIALLAGLFLPLLLILFVWGSQKMSELSVEPPRYALVYGVSDYDYMMRPLTLRVENQRLVAMWKAPDNNKDGYSSSRDYELVLIDPVTQEKKTASLDIPKDAAPNTEISLTIPEPFASLKIYEGQTAPDGYHVEDTEQEYRGGLTREVFGHGNGKKIVLSKEGRKISLRATERQWTPIKIIGWVVP